MLSWQLFNFAFLAQNCHCQYVNKWVWPLHPIKPYLQNQVMGQSWPAGYSLPTSAIAKQIRCKQKKIIRVRCNGKSCQLQSCFIQSKPKVRPTFHGANLNFYPSPRAVVLFLSNCMFAIISRAHDEHPLSLCRPSAGPGPKGVPRKHLWNFQWQHFNVQL